MQCIAGIVITVCCKPNQSLVGDIEGILQSSQIVITVCCKPNQSLVGDIEGILQSSQIVLPLY